MLNFFARGPRAVILAVVLVCAAAALGLPSFGSGLLPEFREGHFVLQVQAIPGTSLAEMTRIGVEISRELLKYTNIATVEQQVGRAEQGEDTFGSHRSEFHIELKENVPGEEQEQLSRDIGGVLDAFPGIQSEVMTFLGDRIAETLTGETAPVVINVYGDDLDAIDAKAKEIAGVLRDSVPGARDVQVKSPPGAPRMAVRLRPDRLAQFGFRPVEVLEAIEAAYEGANVAQVHRGSQVIGVMVILEPASRREPEEIGSLMLKNAQGLSLPLNELADIYLTTGRYSIMHEGASRRQVVTCRPEGRDVTSFVADAKNQIAQKVSFPKGVYAIFSGAAEAAKQAQQQLLLNSAMAGVGIVILLTVVTGNWRNLMLILMNVPFALVGGVLAVFSPAISTVRTPKA